MRQRPRRLSALFEKAGLKAPVLENIRDEIWLKLWGNLTFNPDGSLQPIPTATPPPAAPVPPPNRTTSTVRAAAVRPATAPGG